MCVYVDTLRVHAFKLLQLPTLSVYMSCRVILWILFVFVLHVVLLQLSPPDLTWQHRQNTHCHIDMRHIILHRSQSTYIFYSKHEPSLILKDLFLVPTNGGIQLQGHMCAAGCLRACGGRRECRSARTGVL